RFVEILEHLKFNGWPTIKSYTCSQLLGAGLTMGHLLISENKIECAARSIISTHIIHGVNANCREEKPRENPISIRSAAMLSKFSRQPQPWFFEHHLWFNGHWIAGLKVHWGEPHKSGLCIYGC
ncbi:hypothetical protein MKW92_052951, partial [Papaver armeniacum]